MKIGTKINRLTTVSLPYKKKHYNQFSTFVDVVCDCGKDPYPILMYKLTKKSPVVSCGCFRKEQSINARKPKILNGAVYNKLTVINTVDDSIDPVYKKDGKSFITCQCECGVIKNFRPDAVTSGRVKSCGCLQKQSVSDASKKHGLSQTPIYKVWVSMKSRCLNPKNPEYTKYGGRGISITKDWVDSFQSFYNDMIETYSESLDLDRIDVNKGYCKDNCRWVERDFGNHNKRKLKQATSKYKGVYFDKSKNKYIARLYKNGVTLFLFSTDDEYLAAVAYDNASEEYYNDRPNKTKREGS